VFTEETAASGRKKNIKIMLVHGGVLFQSGDREDTNYGN